MADNLSARPLSSDTLATDYIGGIHYIRAKMVAGADGTATDVSSTNPLAVAVAPGNTTAAIGHTLTGSPPVSQQAVTGATTYLGIDLRETTGTTAATVVLYDNTSAAGTILGTYSLAAGESRAEEFSVGRRAATGIYAAITGTVQGTVFAST